MSPKLCLPLGHEVQSIQADVLRTLSHEKKRFQLIDVRSMSEFDEGHIPGALHIAMEHAESRLDDFEALDPVILVCQSGQRARLTCGLMAAHRDNLFVLDGGIKAWLAADFPVVRTSTTRLGLIRQVHIIAGSLILLGTTLGGWVAPQWNYIAMFVGVGLFVAGSTGFCAMAIVLAKMPWNKVAKKSL